MISKPLLRFVILAIALYIIWFLSYDFVIAPDGRTDAWLNKVVADHSAILLNLIGYSSDTAPGIKQTILRINECSMVGVGNPCNGLELFVLFAGFIICFPGPVNKKLFFIPAGILIIHFVNVIRSAALALIQFKNPENLEFNHHYTFTILVYAIIFGLWMIWVNRYSGLVKNKRNALTTDVQ
jgi:exosortase family protein XrtF